MQPLDILHCKRCDSSFVLTEEKKNNFQSICTAFSTYTHNPSAEQKKFRLIVWGLLKGILCRQSLSEVEADEAGRGKEGTPWK